MEKLNVEIVTELTPARWVQDSLMPWAEEGHLHLGSIIPPGFESYISIRCANRDRKIGPEGLLDYANLSELLSRNTSTPEVCYMALWYGFGWNVKEEFVYLFEEIDFPENFFLEIPNRSYYLFKGSIEENLKIGHKLGNHFFHEPINMMWPKDKSWFFAKEIDFDVCLIGGSHELISQIVSSGNFVTETFAPIQRTNEIFICD